MLMSRPLKTDDKYDCPLRSYVKSKTAKQLNQFRINNNHPSISFTNRYIIELIFESNSPVTFYKDENDNIKVCFTNNIMGGNRGKRQELLK